MLPNPRASLEDGCLDPSKRSIWTSLTFCSGVKAPSMIEVCLIVRVKTPPTYVCVDCKCKCSYTIATNISLKVDVVTNIQAYQL